jgi:hypothetical protein
VEKISGIIPGSARVTSVDAKDSTPVRPGTPAFGRRDGVSVLKEKEAAKAKEKIERDQMKAESATAKTASAAPDANDWKAKDSARAELAAQVTDKFFNRGPKPEAKEPEPEQEGVQEMNTAPRERERFNSGAANEVASKGTPMKIDDFGNSLRAAAMRPVDSFGHEEQDEEIASMPRLKQPEGLYPKGSFIDRTA